ncbi:hypothetical protein GBA52_015237 [Prunus armeniaca]|nr:hypothetical protein GBA52_015237 [Prunus armeniaca]
MMGSCGFDDILEAVQLAVTSEMNARLLLHFRREELEKALGQMFPTKSSRMDMIIAFHEKYLGLPTMTRRNKTQMFQFVRENLWRRLTTWNGKLLSAAGKEVLIKVVAQALPIYTMSVFKLP